MNFKSYLSDANKKEFVKSWTSSYQTGLLTFKQKRQAGDVGVIKPIFLYPLALFIGYFLVACGMQITSEDFSGIEIIFSVAVLFFIAFNLAYTIRGKWFGFLANRNLFPQQPLDITLSTEGITYREEGFSESTTWLWSEVVRVLSFARTVVIYNKECKGFLSCKGHVLVLNKDSLSKQQRDQLQDEFITPLKLEQKFRIYYSYSDILIFLILCLFVALLSIPLYM